VSTAQKAKWANMIETYLNKREGLINVLQLVDIRHKPTDDDVLMLDWIRRSGFSPVVIATKKDKLKKSQVQGAIDIIKDTLSVDTVIPFSAEKGDGCSEVWDVINTILKEAGF
jgi:GTP-binding protein